MGAVGDLVVRLLGDTTQLDSSIRKSEKNLRKFGESAARVGKKLTTFVTLPILGIGAAFVKAAADAEETNSKFNTVFRNQADAVRDWAREFGDATGRSTIETVKFLASVQDLFVPLGLAREEATVLSKSVVTLATDMASFNNLPTKDVLRDIQSALVGNVETVRKYGVVLNAATVEQELLNMGIEGGNKAATAAEKALARYNLIVAGTADAQGDAVRTADSFTNRFIALKSSIIDLAQSFGEILIPAVQKMVEGLTKAIKFVEGLDEGQKKLIVRIALLAAAIGPLILIVGKSITIFIALKRAILLATRAMLKLMLAMLTNPAVLLAVAIATLVAGIVLLAVAIREANKVSREEKKLDKEIIALKDTLTKVREEERVAILRNILAKQAERIATLETLRAEIEERQRSRTASMGATVATKIYNEELGAVDKKLENARFELGLYSLQLRGATEKLEEEIKQRKILLPIIEDGTDALTENEIVIKVLSQEIGLLTEQDIDYTASALKNYIARQEAAEEEAAKIKAASDAIEQRRNELADAFFATTLSIASSISQIWSNLHQQRMDEIDAELQATLDGLDIQMEAAIEAAGVANETLQDKLNDVIAELAAETDAERKAALEEEKIELERQIALKEITDEFDILAQDAREAADAEKRKLAHDEAIRNKIFALFDIVVNTAVAVSKLLTNPLLMFLAGLAGAAQGAVVLAQPIPALAEGGIITEPTVLLAGEAGPEIVAPLDSMPMHVTVQLGSNVLFDEITQGTRDRNILIDQGAIA